MAHYNESWYLHVRYEIMDSGNDPDRLLQITNCLQDMEDADLIPDEIASDLFNVISLYNASNSD
jgi:hypothetical protein